MRRIWCPGAALEASGLALGFIRNAHDPRKPVVSELHPRQETMEQKAYSPSELMIINAARLLKDGTWSSWGWDSPIWLQPGQENACTQFADDL